jgi:hypothetical protein
MLGLPMAIIVEREVEPVDTLVPGSMLGDKLDSQGKEQLRLNRGGSSNKAVNDSSPPSRTRLRAATRLFK